MPDIFVSYTEADRPISRYVALELQKRGAAPRSHSLDECDHFLLIYSPRSAADPQVKAEIVAALVQEKPIAVLTVELSPLSLPDFLFLLDTTTIHFKLTAPDQAEATLNAMAGHYGLPEQSFTPPDDSLFDFSQPIERQSEDGSTDLLQPHASDIEFPASQEALDDVLFSISGLGEQRFGAAMTLLLWLPRFAGDYINAVRGFRDRQLTFMRSRWLQQLEKQSQAALKANNDAQLQTLTETLRVVDPLHPLWQQLQSGLRERRITALWKQIQSQAEAEGWTSVGELLDEMRSVSPLDQRTLQAVERFQSEIECQDLADIAERAATGGYNHAFAHLMQYIQQRCPDFEDTRDLLSNLQLSKELVEYLKPKHVLRGGSGVQTMVFSPDSTLLVSGGTDGVLRLWDIEQAQQVARQSRDDGAILSLAYSPDGMLLVNTTETGVLRLWQMPEGREVATIDQFSDRVTCVCFTPDGQALICGSSSGAVLIVRIEDGLVMYDSHTDAPSTANGNDQRHYYAITSLSIAEAEDGEVLVLTSSDDKTVKVWRLEADSTLTFLHNIAQHTMIVREAVFSDTDPLLAASVGNDGLVCVWSPQTGELVNKLVGQGANQVRSVTFVPEQTLLVTGGTDRIITLWDAESTQPLHQLTHHEGSINALAFSPDGLWLASGSSDHTIVLWHL